MAISCKATSDRNPGLVPPPSKTAATITTLQLAKFLVTLSTNADRSRLHQSRSGRTTQRSIIVVPPVVGQRAALSDLPSDAGRVIDHGRPCAAVVIGWSMWRRPGTSAMLRPLAQ